MNQARNLICIFLTSSSALTACGELPTAVPAPTQLTPPATTATTPPTPVTDQPPVQQPAPVTVDENTNGMNGNNSTAGNGNFTIGPTYTVAPEWTVDPKVPHGVMQDFNISSAGSQFYNVTPSFERHVSVYIPAQYKSPSVAPVMVVQDGSAYSGTMHNLLDNLIAAKQLPVLLAVFIDPGPGDERSIEYDTVSDKFATFVETEVMPVVASTYHVAFTADPWGRATLGGSSGGSASFSMAWFRPDLYRRVATYSGSYTALQPSATYPDGAGDYPNSIITNAPNRNLRVALEVGELDHVFPEPFRNTIVANQEMFTVLTSKGYNTRFVYALGAQHVDSRVMNQIMPDTLRWLWRGYPIQ